jgi:4-hydroxybenzoate polyprenyltransferase
MLLLLDGRRLSADALAALLCVPLTACAMANYGYAINDLFDIDEDARAARANAATSLGRRHVAAIALGSALAAGMLATLAAGVAGAAVTFVELCLPLLYSVPPVGLKERGWLGAASDGLAAHVYPAVLALLAVGEWNLRPAAAGLSVVVIVWAAAAGLRGILSHQLHNVEVDRRAGLMTVVHGLGATRLEAFIVGVVLPVETAAFAAALALADTGAVLWTFAAVYVALELFKTAHGNFTVTAFRPGGQRYLPLVEEGFYKAWGPIVLALDAARHDLRYLLVIPAYGLAFRLHLLIEWRRLLLVRDALRTMGQAARSSGES